MKRVRIIIKYILALLLFILAFYGVRYTSDMDTYQLYYDKEVDFHDYAFDAISIYLRMQGYDFMHLFHLCIIIIGVLTVFHIGVLKRNPILIIFIILLTNYVAIGNQIRFFIAFPLVLLSFYFFKVKDKRIIALLLTILAASFHNSILLMIGMIIIAWCLLKMKSGTMLLGILTINLVMYYIVGNSELSSQLGKASYLESEYTSSFAGGLFNLFPSLLSIVLIYSMNSNIKRQFAQIYKDDMYQYLLIVSFAPVSILLLGIYMQIIVTRFANSLLYVWTIYYIYIIINTRHKLPRSIFQRAFLYLYVTIGIRLIWLYVLPVLGIYKSNYLPQLLQMINSYRL